MRRRSSNINKTFVYITDEKNCKRHSISPDVVNQPTIFTTSEELIYFPAGKDLGISMLSDLTLSKHVLDMCARANHRCKAMFSGDKRRGDQPDSVSVIGSLGFVLIKPDLVASNRLPFS